MIRGSRTVCPTVYSQRKQTDLLAVLLEAVEQGLDAHDALLHIVVGLPDMAILARVDDVQQPVGTDIARSCFRHGQESR